MKWWYAFIIIGLLGSGYWVYTYVTAPVPGQEVSDLGRAHVSFEEVEKTTYNSNPPTSGPHLETWVKAGVYDAPQSEGQLIHSLEHGYVIISYNCNVHLSENSKSQAPNLKQFSIFNFQFSKVDAHEEGEESSPSGQASGSASLNLPSEAPLRQGFEGQATESAMNETEGCKSFVKQLDELANRKRIWKLIVVPRPQLDTTIALTAWGYIDTFDPPAGGFDNKRITRFIDYHRDHGPEKTME
ncbi:DUF3105 domain-containing protein [Candidatus Gottesmanbacteria bacterium]|nr:DUF3105 domain-containing protein [Candidatus Gottesmanbacteria bacterium]